MQITFRVKHAFFDRPSIQKRIGKRKAKALSKAGSYVRKTARELLGRKVKKPKPNKPGGTPRVRSDGLNFKKILFFYDESAGKLIVGPVGFSSAGTLTKKTPGIHERGGTARIRVRIATKRKPKRLRAKVFRKRNQNSTDDGVRRNAWRNKNMRTVSVRYPKRPFMAPALKKRRKEIPLLFKDLLK